MRPVIKLHINKAFYGDIEVPALRMLDFYADKGEAAVILGKSGCGKSTLLNIIASLHKGFSGELTVEDGSAIGYIPQNKCLLPWKTVIDNVMLLGRLKNPPEPSRAEEILEQLGISRLKKKYPGRLSGGEYQRVLLGQILYYRPRVLLMDEPFSALDGETKEDIMKLFAKLQREREITTVFVTHNNHEAETVGSRVIKL